MLDGERSSSAGAKPFHASTCVIAAFLIKLAKHLALLACFTIIGASSGRVVASEIAIFSTIVAAALLHSIGRVIDQQKSPGARFFRWGP